MQDAVLSLIAGFVVAVVLTPVGISGAFLLVPFQTTVLGVSSVSVTPTNLLFNVIATPLTILAHRRHGRLDGRLAGLIVAGSVPGAVGGVWVRVRLLSDPARFDAVIGAVLLALAASLWLQAPPAGDPSVRVPRDLRTDLVVLGSAALVGVVGGVYGVGGGVFLAPLLVAVTGCSVLAIAGATLSGTFVTSVVGVAVFWLAGGPGAEPSWASGSMLGLGGLAGGWVGARLHARVPERALRGVLTGAVGGLGLFYLARWLQG